ncbi:MAG TPA: hypothetical protein VG474_01525 [Solirubrobacteraceae bacterium]|nr:hypothetical protein [Solirubrobacteraceae bacterium]
MRLTRRAVVAAAIGALGLAGAPAGAQAPPPHVERHFFAADATQAGVISLHFFGARGAPVTFYERVGSTLRRLGAKASASDPTVLRDAATWRCDRLVRRFAAGAPLAGGRLAVGEYSVRTASCKTRLELAVPRRLAPGEVGRIRVRDRWGNGGLRARLCLTPPHDPRTCDRVRLRRAISVATRRVRPRETGRWRVELRFRGHRLRRSIAVGSRVRAAAPPPTVLATGDSTMQGIDTFLADELGDAAKVHSDIRPGTGIAKPFGPWATLARTQTRRLRQAATVASLGIVDRFPLTTGETRLECCGPGWIAEYARRLRAMMQTYRRGGHARVLWLTLPLPQGPRDLADAVNLAVVHAARGLVGVGVLRLDLVFTPEGFREVMPYRGRLVDVREEDGIHLNITGTAIAAKLVAEALRRR